MEGALNNCFVDFLHRKLGKGYAKHLKPYLFMKIQDRLEMAPLLLSNFEYELQANSNHVKEVLRLFDLRNQFLHVKHLWHYADVRFDDDGHIVGFEYHNKAHPDPYRGDSGSWPQSKELRTLFKAHDRFIHRFSSLNNAISRKSFKADEWVQRVKRT